MKIPIQNLYYLFTYAWGRFPAGESAEVGVEDCPDLPNLFARLLINGCNRLLRRGVDRGYQGFVEETRAPRGHLLLDQIVKRQTLRRGAVVCAFDELTADVLHNQILKAGTVLLARADNVTDPFRHELRLIARRLGDVSDIRLTAEAFRRVQLSRNTSEYLPLLKLCELVFWSLLPTEGGAGSRFADILKNETVMSAVFEDFLYNFYTYEQRAYAVTRDVMTWNAVPADPASEGFLPIMKTDISLRSAERMIIFDAKFYPEALPEHYGSRKVRSAHLYQLTAYLEHARRRHTQCAVGGGLIYPAVGESLRLRYLIHEIPVVVATIDLARPWPEIHEELLALLATAEPHLPEQLAIAG